MATTVRVEQPTKVMLDDLRHSIAMEGTERTNRKIENAFHAMGIWDKYVEMFQPTAPLDMDTIIRVSAWVLKTVLEGDWE